MSLANHVIDLRSDTVTRPTPAMRKAMADAEVGDDYYRADPTVTALEEKAAAMLGMEAALLVLSGTMGNLVSILAQTTPGQSVVLADNCHILLNEAGGIAAVGGLLPRPVPAPRGVIDPADVAAALLTSRPLAAPTTLLCLENTHNAAGGRVLGPGPLAALVAVAREHGLGVHVDGARIFNAAAALGRPVGDILTGVDSVTFCLTKGLGCPSGSLVAGSRAFIEEARNKRQLLGGNMRQAGAWAAAGLVALDGMVDRLAEDHANARLLATLLAETGLPVQPAEVETNMVFFEVPTARLPAAAFVAGLGERGVIVNPPKGRRVRFVTHHDVDEDGIREAARRVADVLAAAA